METVTELSLIHRSQLLLHFLALDAEDRRLRLGVPIADTSVRIYVAGIDFDRDALFGTFDEELALAGVAHLARAPEHAELGLSVLRPHRNLGIGGALLMRAALRARNWGVRTLFMHCLGENETMMHIARKQGMCMLTESGQANAWLGLPPADAVSHFGEVFVQRVALLDYALKAQLATARQALRHARLERESSDG